MVRLIPKSNRRGILASGTWIYIYEELEFTQSHKKEPILEGKGEGGKVDGRETDRDR